MEKIFVSYGRKDLERVQLIVQELNKLGLDFWMDTRSLQVGDVWTTEITKGIESCGTFLLFMSENSMLSDNVRREVQLAYEKKRKIYLLRLDDTPVPKELQFLIAGLHWIKVDTENWQTRLALAIGSGASPPIPSDIPHPDKKIKPQIEHQYNVKRTTVDVDDVPAYHGGRSKSGEVGFLSEHSGSFNKILPILERMCYNGNLSLLEFERLKIIIAEVAMNKSKQSQNGEEPMLTSSDNFYFQSSRTFTQFLVSLADYHETWPDLKFGDSRKRESLNLLRELHDHILTTTAMMDRLYERAPKVNIETKKIIKVVEKLRSKLAGIDKYLYSGTPPFEVTEELDENFDDLYFHLSKFILSLDDIGSISTNQKHQ